MIGKIIGMVAIIVGCWNIGTAIWHLVNKLKIPKSERIWWGLDVAIQAFFYPMGVYFIIFGIYQFMV